MPSLTISIESDIEYTQEDIDNRIKILGELIIEEIRKNIRSMNLIIPGGGELLQKWFSTYTNNTLIIESGTLYGQFLEYGTYEYWDQYGFDDYPEIPDPKKKELTKEARKAFPKGVQPFAFVRKVLYNTEIMRKLIIQAFS